VPYKGSGPMIVDLVGGQVDYTFATPAVTLPFARAGKLKILAVGAAQRLGAAEEVPTVDEAGLPGFGAGSWYGVMVPAGTPAPVVQRLNAEVVAGMRANLMRNALDALSIVPTSSTPAELGQLIRAEIASLQALAAKIGLEAE